MEQAIPRTHTSGNAADHFPLVMLAVVGNHEMSDADLCNGTAGYLLRASDPQSLLAAITAMHQGTALCTTSDARKVVLQLRPEPVPATHPRLSGREMDVLRALVQGLSYKMIAHKLDISFETVRSHIKRVYEKLQVHNNTEAVAKAINSGMLA